MYKFRLIFFLFLASTFALNAQMTKRDIELVDSFQKIILKQKNDTAVIFYEALKDNSIYWNDPARSVKTLRSLLELAKRTKHPNSFLKIYSLYERALWRLAEKENDLVKKERYLRRADSLMKIHLDHCLTNFTGERLIINAADPIGRWRKLSEISVKHKEEYFQKETDGYSLLLNKYELRKYPNHFIGIMFGMAVAYQNQLKTAGAVKYYLMLAQYTDSTKRFDQATEFYNNLGFSYFADGNYAMAQKYYFYALKSFEHLPPDSFKIGNKYKERLDNRGAILTNIANIFSLQKNYEQSVDYFKQALSCFVLSENNDFYILFSYRLGIAYANSNKIDSAENYLRKFRKLTYMIKDTNQLKKHEIRINLFSAIIESKKKNYGGAVNYALNAIKIAGRLNDANSLLDLYGAVGGYLMLNDQPQKALEYYNKQLTFLNTAGGWKEKTFSKIYADRGKAFTKLNMPDSAIASLLIAKSLAEKVNIKQEMNFVYQALAEAYIAAKLPNEAIDYLKKHIQYKDSLVGDQVTQQITSIGLKYESDMKLLNEKTIREKQQLENQKKDEQQAQQRNILIIIIVSVSLLVVVAAYSLLKIKKANALLETQKKEIEEQRNIVVHQKHIVEEKNKEITDSIQYAKRIQTALIHTQPHLTGNFKDHFIFFKPKDIVSGDFYWSALQNEHLYVAACDCTGHGVPGAFMSLLNISFLNEAIIQKKLIDPNKVFDFVKNNLVTNLAFDDSKDGMDACLLHVNKTTRTITYSAANNKPVIIRGNELIELPCDKMPVGKSYAENDFTLYNVDYKENDILYMFTDGYKDQFGGKENKKLNSKMFKKLLLEFSRFDFATQKEKIKSFFAEWQGNIEQTDDVCVIGLKL